MALLLFLICVIQGAFSQDLDYGEVFDRTTYRSSRPRIRRPRDYRIEVEFLNFENPGSIRHTGEYCDSFTKCDPSLKAMIDIDQPQSRYPGVAKLADFKQVASAKDSDTFSVNKKISRTLCNRPTLPTMVTVRVEVHDQDTFTDADLLEQFDCCFPFDPYSDDWSEVTQCKAVHQPNIIKLSYRWRIVPVTTVQCRMSNSDEVSVAASTGRNAEGTSGTGAESQGILGQVLTKAISGAVNSAIDVLGLVL